jgi:hypothetical protein
MPNAGGNIRSGNTLIQNGASVEAMMAQWTEIQASGDSAAKAQFMNEFLATMETIQPGVTGTLREQFATERVVTPERGNSVEEHLNTTAAGDNQQPLFLEI